MKGGSVKEFTKYGVYVGENVTSAELTRVKIEGKGSGQGTGVHAKGGETVTLTEVTISRVQTGVYAEKGTFKMDGGEIKEFTGYGVSVGENVTSAELTRVKIEGKGSGQGTGVHAKGGETVTLDDVKISRVETGIYAKKGMLKMTEGSVKDFTEYGVSVGENVTSAELTRVKIEGKGSGQGTGVHAKGGETVTLNEVKISKVRVGVDVEKGTLIMKGESTISLANGNSYGVGVYVGDKVESATLMGTTITGQNSGKGSTGIYAVGAESLMMTLEGVKISGVTKGVSMEKGESLTISGGSRIEFTGDYGVGVYVGDKVESATLMGTTITGQNNGIGVYTMGSENLTMTLDAVRILGVGKGVYMEKGKSLTISGRSRISFMGSYGVMVGGGVTSADLKDVTIRGKNNGTGVHAVGKEGMVMTLDGVTVSQVETGVMMMGKGCW
ncbi:right-handed parallel beta-helix repeat-containing protein [Bartonella schoenbuchensis]|uniref:right-handed parallel beta-helix repeat-containing protein n=1 Tax=Bartonella schoenbuchensis TaxID=165694 RepID=UPI0030842FBF